MVEIEMPKKALILVDLQNDFCEGGSLAAPNASSIMPVANELSRAFELVIATQDWHPEEHKSFAVNHAGHEIGDIVNLGGTKQILWPSHCVQGSKGAEFHPHLDSNGIHKVVLKGTHPEIDSYSAFYDNAHQRSTGLAEFLRDNDVSEVFIMGLVTEYCVKFSAIDALSEGFKVTVVIDGCRAVNIHPNDETDAIKEMKNLGIKFIESKDLLTATTQ